jgi:hypothetical protein
MALINEGASFPSFMWAVVRLLLLLGGKADAETAKLVLTPPTLPPGETKEFSTAVKSLADLEVVADDGEVIVLTPAARSLAPDDVAGFNRLLRRAVLVPDHNNGLANSPDLDGPKDLVRALAWFLTRDPLVPQGWESVAQFQRGAFASHLPPPIANDVRWGRFAYWAPALGFAAAPLIPREGRSPLVPDCTVAVRETALSLWQEGQTVRASEAVERIVEELPVLPGGRYSRMLGLAPPDGRVAASLSNALLAGEVDGWLKLSSPSDAGKISLADGTDTREVSLFTISGRV